MRATKRRRRLAVVVGLVVAAAAAGFAYASIPASDGVIHACYSPNGATGTNGAQLNIVDRDVAACSKGQREITWNQTGPAGPKGDKGEKGDKGDKGDQGDPGPASDAPAYTNYGGPPQSIPEGATQTVASVTLPAGSYTLMATAHVSRDGDTRFAQCSFGPGNVNAAVALFPVHAVGGIRLPIIGDVTTATGTPVFLRCWGLDGAITASGALIATRVGSVIPSE